MEVSDRTGKIIQALEPHMEFLHVPPHRVLLSLMGLYKDIAKGAKVVSKLRRAGQLVGNLVPVPKGLDTRLKGGSYFPSAIKEHIVAHTKHLLIYKATIDGREISIEFGITEDQLGDLDRYEEYADFMVQWLYVCGIYSKDKCARTLDVRMFLTGYEKLLPDKANTVLGPANVNTGYSYFCAPIGEIVLYRSEEWKKVFIHETFHAYGLDFGCSNTGMVERIKAIFPVKSEFNISEAYTETWARICNSAMCAYSCVSGKPTEDKFMQAVQFNIGVERMYAAIQCAKVLKHMGLDYGSLIDTTTQTSALLRTNLYRENSNVLAYYVITASLLSSYPQFITWCRRHNTVLLRFRSTEKNFKSFTDLIEESARSKEFLALLESMKSVNMSHMKNSLTMSAIEGV